MHLYCDNKLAISITQNLVQHDWIKYIEINRYLIREKIDTDIIYIPLHAHQFSVKRCAN